MTKPKRPRDPNQLAKLIVDIATGEVEDDNPDADKDPQAIERGSKGGKIASDNLTPEQRKERASKAAAARWKK